MRIVTEQEFAERIREVLKDPIYDSVGCVTGPGRSGAIAAVYASHILSVPFITHGNEYASHLGRILVIDTAIESGRTLRKAANKYKDCIALALYQEPPRIAFWYEAPKPQRMRKSRELFTSKVIEQLN